MHSKRAFVIVLPVCMAVCFAILYYLYDPVEVRWMPRCIWNVATGIDCPGCGSQRMAHALMHGDIAGAWHANAYALCMIPLIVFMLWLELFREKSQKLYRMFHSPVVIWTLGCSVLVWWIVRNLI